MFLELLSMNPKSILNMTITMLLILFFVSFAVWVYRGVKNQDTGGLAISSSRASYTVESRYYGMQK